MDTLRADTLWVFAADGEDSGAINISLVYPDTIKARLGTALHVRADDGQDDADLNVYDVSATNEVDGALADFTIGEFDTIGPSSGEDLYVRAADGQDDGVLHVYELQACLVYADTAKCGIDTTFYIRSDDGQDDTLLDGAFIGGVATATVETVYVTGQIQGGTRDYIWLNLDASTNIAENSNISFHTYDSDIHGLTAHWDEVLTGKFWGTPMIRDGSITGVVCQYGIEDNPYDATDSVWVRVYVNGDDDSTMYAIAAVDSTGAHGPFPVFYKTQAPGVSTFSAGDLITARWASKGTGDAASTYQYAFLRIEVQYDD